MAITLTLNQVQLIDNQLGMSGVAFYTDAAIANSKNRIGELKTLKLQFNTSKSIYGFKLYYDPALFINTATPPPVGVPNRYYYLLFPTSGTGTFTASYNAPGALFPNIDKLAQSYVIINSSTQFEIYIQYYQSYDYEGFLEPNLGDNKSHLLKDKKSSAAQLTVTGNSVYNTTAIDFRCYIYMEDNFVPTDNGSLDVNPAYGYKAGFYQQGTHGVATYFTNPALTLSRSSSSVSSLSTVQDTLVEFAITTPSLAVNNFVARIIRTDKNDNTVDFQANYEMESIWVNPGGTATSKFKQPFIAPFLSAPNVYSCSFYIDKTGLTLGGKYRIIIHSYHNTFPTNYEADVFISDELEVIADVPYTGNGFDVSAQLRDILFGFSGNYLTCTIEERIKSKITFDFIDDYGVGMYARDIYNRLGITINNDISRYLTQVEFQIYERTNTFLGYIDQIVDKRTAYQVSPGLFFQPGLSLAFGTGTATFEADWRNRYEAGVPNIESRFNGILIPGPPTSNQYWGGRSFFIEWKLTFYYDDYVTPFTDDVIIQQKMNVKDYSSCLNIYAQNPPDDTKEFWCPEDTMCLRAELNPACLGGIPASDYELVTTIEPDPGSITTIQETEVFATSLLPQLQSPLILSQEDYYSTTLANNAKFCVDVANLTLTDYKISALAKKL